MLEWIGLIVGAVIVLLAIIAIVIYNSLVTLQKRVNNAWAQIDVQLKRRVDLIPNLIETVKGYARFEKKVLTEVTKARTSIMNAKGPAESAKGENMLEGALKTIFAVAENYPKLRASENFKSLQEEFSTTENKIAYARRETINRQLATTENKISYARQFYNDSVMQFNTAIAVFPNNVFAGMFGFGKPREYFEIGAAARKPVKADFSDLA